MHIAMAVASRQLLLDGSTVESSEPMDTGMIAKSHRQKLEIPKRI